MNTFVVVLLLAAVVTLWAGCAISDRCGASSGSSATSSVSSSISSDSSSRSSSPDTKEAAYRDDVRDYTEAYVKSGGQFDAFQKRIGELARRYDITNWEDSLATWEGIGAGLARARASQTQVYAFKQHLAGGDARKMEALQKAYNAHS